MIAHLAEPKTVGWVLGLLRATRLDAHSTADSSFFLAHAWEVAVRLKRLVTTSTHEGVTGVLSSQLRCQPGVIAGI